MRRSFKSAGRGRVHARSSSGAGGTVGIGSRRFDRSAGTGWRAILWRTRRSGRSAPRLSGPRAGGSERGRRAGSAACERPRKRAWGPIRSPSGIGPSAAGRLVEGDCSRSVGRLRGEVDRVRADGRPSRGSGLCARSLDARSGPLERDRSKRASPLFRAGAHRLRRRQERSAPERVARVPSRAPGAPDASFIITRDSRPQLYFAVRRHRHSRCGRSGDEREGRGGDQRPIFRMDVEIAEHRHRESPAASTIK